MKWDLKKAKSLKENERFKYVFIQSDLTKTERENTICLWNVEGAKGTLSTCTIEAIAYDILLLTETFSLNSVEIPGFTCFCTKAIKSGKGRLQSGLAIALSNQLRNTCNVLHQNSKLLAVQIKEFSLIIIVAYFPPKIDLETIYQALTEAFQC